MNLERFRPVSAGHIIRILAAARDAAVTFLFPDGCVACGSPLAASRRHLCPVCRSALRGPGSALELPLPGDSPGSPQRNRRAFYALEFEDVTRAVVHALKYEGRTSLACTLASAALPAALEACAGPPDAVTPVPLHPVRLRERGFNQSALLAARLAAAMNVPVRTTLRRVCNTPPQAGLSRSGRMAMRPSAFRAAADPGVSGRVLLVDDVVTTGATLCAAAQTLLDAGAGEVVCFAVAGTRSRAPEGAHLAESG